MWDFLIFEKRRKNKANTTTGHKSASAHPHGHLGSKNHVEARTGIYISQFHSVLHLVLHILENILFYSTVLPSSTCQKARRTAMDEKTCQVPLHHLLPTSSWTRRWMTQLFSRFFRSSSPSDDVTPRIHGKQKQLGIVWA